MPRLSMFDVRIRLWLYVVMPTDVSDSFVELAVARLMRVNQSFPVY